MNMDTNLSPVSWSAFLGAWDVGIVSSLVCAVLLIGYLACRLAQRGAAGPPHPWWRTAGFVGGVVLLWLAVSSGLAVYGEVLFWVHMLLHLTLITVVPALLVLGSPISVVRRGLGNSAGVRLLAPIGAVVLHPAAGFAAYTAVIVGTHLTSFMDHMDAQPWLEPTEQVLYVAAGWLLLTPLVGDEPIRWQPPMLGRVLLLVLAMVPDTIVGIVLLQSSTAPYPHMFPGTVWGPEPLDDAQTGGAIMWVGGDGLMMVLAVALVIALIAGHGRDQVLGSWLESARSAHLRDVTGADTHGGGDVDDDPDALEAYNLMLQCLDDP